MMDYEVRFYQLDWDGFGRTIPIWVGVSSDGTIWVDPVGLGVRPRDLDTRNFKGQLALVDPLVGRIYINARALVEMQIVPEGREAMAVCMDRLVNRLKKSNLLPNHDAVRNN